MATMAAVDLGAQSGRVALGRFDGERLAVDEVHRFPNVPVRVQGRCTGTSSPLRGRARRAARRGARGRRRVDSVGVDSWGVDFALLDRAGRLVQNPVHYRDARRARRDRARARAGARRASSTSAPASSSCRSTRVFQLGAMAAERTTRRSSRRDAAPDPRPPALLAQRRARLASCTNATTTAVLRPARRAPGPTTCSSGSASRRGCFADVVAPGDAARPAARGGRRRDAACAAPRVIAPRDARHRAPPSRPCRSAAPASAYISAGTWSLVGLELPAPLIDDRDVRRQPHERGRRRRHRPAAAERHRPLAPARVPARLGARGHELRVRRARRAGRATRRRCARSSTRTIPLFAAPGDMPARIRDFCARDRPARARDAGRGRPLRAREPRAQARGRRSSCSPT